MSAEAQYTQLQFDGMEDPIYVCAKLLDIFASASIIERPEGDLSDAEHFFRIGSGIYELFMTSENGLSFELDGPGFVGDVYVHGSPSGEEAAKRICRVVLDYAAGRVVDGDTIDLDRMPA